MANEQDGPRSGDRGAGPAQQGSGSREAGVPDPCEPSESQPSPGGREDEGSTPLPIAGLGPLTKTLNARRIEIAGDDLGVILVLN
jgi:hypothetical protein